MNTLSLPEIVNRCCNDAPGGHAIDKPWRKDGRTLATDGRILISVDATLVGSEAPKKRKPDTDNVLRHIESIDNWIPPEIVPTCRECQGASRVTQECRECWGSGETICDLCEQECDCYECDGTGEVGGSCDTCYQARVSWFTRKVAHRYAWLITQVPGVRIGTTDDDPLGPVFFHAVGVTGVVMPMKQEASE